MVAIGEAMSQCHQPQISKCTHYTLCQVVRSYKTITLKMSAFGTFPYYAPPKGLSNTLGRCPKPHARRVAGVQATPTANTYTPTTEHLVASNL